MADFRPGWMRHRAASLEPPAVTLPLSRHERPPSGCDRSGRLIQIDKIKPMSRRSQKPHRRNRPGDRPPPSRPQRRVPRRPRRVRRDQQLREHNWIAAHIRERRFELELTQQEVAERAGTAHSYISKLEGGDHMPTIPVLQRILRVLGEELLIGIEQAASWLSPEQEPDHRAEAQDRTSARPAP